MARDRELFFTFSDVGATTNVAAVDRDITTTPFRGGLVTLVSTANQWAVGYSDSMNYTQWRNQIADTTNLISGVAASAIPGDPILPNGTALSEYFLRAAVAPVGFVGPEACQFIVQAANDTGAGAAPTALTAYSQVSTVGTCPATATALSVAIGGMTGATPSVVTPTGVVPPSGTIIMFTNTGGAGSWTVRTPYVVLQTSATTFIAATSLGGTTTQGSGGANAAIATLLVGNNATQLTPVSLVDATDRILFAEPVSVGDTIIMGAAGSVTGLTAGTLYYVTGVFSDGVTLSTSSGGSTVAIGGTVANSFFGKVNFNTLNAIFPSAGSGTTITTAVPHGLVPGQFVVPASTAGGLTSGLGYYVLTTPTQTTFTVAATINGAAVAISSTPGILFVGRQPKIVNVQVGMTTRPWLRMAVQQLNGSAVQDGYIAIYNADVAVSRDSAQVA